MSGDGKTVCVTGASGYIASWLVKLLLQRGYTVRGTVRNPNDPKKTEHLRALDGASERLHLFKAELLEDGAFDGVINGCDGVFHTASPFTHTADDPQLLGGKSLIRTIDIYALLRRGMLRCADLIDPAVKGTLNVLRSCAKSSSVKRVVVTSSLAAIAYNDKPLAPDVVVDETWFTDPEFCTKAQAWYVLSKTLAEQAAWKFAKENAIEMVVVNPGMVIGPLLQPTLNTSAAAILDLINGSSTFPNLCFPWVDIKDVGEAHILAFEVASARGRYCLVERVAHYSEVVKILQELFPTIQLPDKCVGDDNPFSCKFQVSKERAKSLGIDFIPMEVSLKETVESLKEKNFVSF